MQNLDPKQLHEGNQAIRQEFKRVFGRDESNITWKILYEKQWGSHKYLVTGNIQLRPETQAVEVIDMTKFSHPRGLKPVTYGMNMLLPGNEFEPTGYLVFWSDEFGQPEVVMEDGSTWPVHFADLAVQVKSPNRDDARSLYDDLLESQFGG